MSSRKQRLGDWLVRTLGINPQTFRAVWMETRAAWVRLRGRIVDITSSRIKESPWCAGQYRLRADGITRVG
jgi:hypothetical protein